MFIGYQSTPLLWHNSEIADLKQLEFKNLNKPFKTIVDKKLRLGKWVEQFVAFLINNQNNTDLVKESAVIKIDNLTIGELDFLFIKEQQPIHLEVVYKFYLYDSKQNYKTHLEYWVGPNKSDRLILKIRKLKEKQLPLLYNNETNNLLEHLHLDASNIKQYVHFKAQLFIPYKTKISTLLNPKCIIGYYLNIEMLCDFKNNEFYIPKKIEWLIRPVNNVLWLNYKDTLAIIKAHFKQKQSPMIWIKHDSNIIEKYFVVWW